MHTGKTPEEVELNNHIKDSQVHIEPFFYQSPNGKIEGFKISTEGNTTGKPVIFLRGGNRNFGALDNQKLAGMPTELAKAGFIVYATQYSGGPNSEGKDEFGGKDVADIFALFDVIKNENNYHGYLGVVGFSRGAIMGCEAIRDGLPVTRAAFIGGAFDCTKTKEERPDLYAMWERDHLFDLTDEELKKRSAVTFAEKLSHVPTLILHAKGDTRVPIRQAEEMAEKSPNSKLHLFESADHALGDQRDTRNKLVISWLNQ